MVAFQTPGIKYEIVEDIFSPTMPNQPLALLDPLPVTVSVDMLDVWRLIDDGLEDF